MLNIGGNIYKYINVCKITKSKDKIYLKVRVNQ